MCVLPPLLVSCRSTNLNKMASHQFLIAFHTPGWCVQGNCTDAPTPPEGVLLLPDYKAPLRKMVPQQCLIALDKSFVKVVSQSLWLDSLYLRLHKLEDEDSRDYIGPLVRTDESDIWMMNVTLQGDGDGIADCIICGLEARRGSMYAEGMCADRHTVYAIFECTGSCAPVWSLHVCNRLGLSVVSSVHSGFCCTAIQLCDFHCRADCVFADFDATMMVYTSQGNRLSMRKCTFAGNFLAETRFEHHESSELPAGAAIFAQAEICDSEELRLDIERDTLVRLEGCSFSTNTSMPALLRETGDNYTASFYHDMPDVQGYSMDHPSMCEATSMTNLTQRLAPKKVAAWPRHERFSSREDQWILDAQQVLV